MIDIKNINYEPSLEELNEMINNELFMEMFNYLKEEYQALHKIEFSKDTWLKGWNVKIRKAGKGLCTIYPKDGYFKILVVIGAKEKEMTEKLLPSMSDEINKIYNETNEGMNQRWLMIDLYSHNQLYKDVLRLIKVRRDSK